MLLHRWNKGGVPELLDCCLVHSAPYPRRNGSNFHSESCTTMSDAETNVLKTIIDALKPLTSEERQRTLEAALVFLGEEPTQRGDS